MKQVMLIAVILMYPLLYNAALADVTTFDAGATQPRDLVVGPDGQYLYVAAGNDGDGYVTKIRLSDLAVVDSVFTDYGPLGIDITPNGLYLYVTNTVNGYYTTKIDVATFTKLDNIHGGTDPAGVAITPDGATACITNHWSPFLQLVSVEADTEIVRIYGIIPGGFGVVVTPDGEYAYVVARNVGSGAVSGIYKVSLTESVVINTINANGEGIEITPDGSEVWVPGYVHSDYVYIVSTLTDFVIDSIAVGSNPVDIAISPDGLYAYVTCYYENSVYKISIPDKKLMGLVSVGHRPRRVALSPDGNLIYTANEHGDSITEVHTDDIINQVWNPNFEDNIDSLAFWDAIQYPSGWFVSDVNPQHGNLCAIFDFPAGPGYYDATLVVTGYDIYVEAGKPCYYSFWIREKDTHDTFQNDKSILDAGINVNGLWHGLSWECLPSEEWQFVDGTIYPLENGIAQIRFPLHGFATTGSSIFAVDNVMFYQSEKYPYLPGDVNMSGGTWPPAATGPDVTYLVNFFRSAPTSIPCYLNGDLGPFWASADANGDCNIIGSDVTKLVNVFRGQGSILYCTDYEPLWLTPADLPAEAPSGWPFCENTVTGKNVLNETDNK